jgi:hypothetical protein
MKRIGVPVKDQTEVADVIREADRKIHEFELRGVLEPGSFRRWNEGTCEAVSELLTSVVDIKED